MNYKRRLTIFMAIFACLLLVCIGRLFQLQIFYSDQARERIDEIGVARPKTLPTLRGKILDRNKEELATDRPNFYLNIKYDMARLADGRFWEANSLIRAKSKGCSTDEALVYWNEQFKDDLENFHYIIEKACSLPNVTQEEVLQNINDINEKMWRMRRYCAWRRNMPFSENFSDYEKTYSEEERLCLEGEINDLAEMKSDWFEICELREIEDKVQAQEIFSENFYVRINTKGKRNYPFASAACQLIGWVNPTQPDEEIFNTDKLLSYSAGEVAGFSGLERVLEPILRGRRGEIVQHKRSLAPEVTPRQFGQDVVLTIDVKLQLAIENFLLNSGDNPNFQSPTGVVVMDVKSGEILAMASTPLFNLGKVRTDYAKIKSNENKPLESRCLYKIYPPGSSIKPVMLVIGLEEKEVTPHTVISCPGYPEKNWPRCWKQRAGSCHDDQWYGEGGNTGENAVRASCNIYFTKLAHKMNARVMQKWLWDFGFGKCILQEPDFSNTFDPLDEEKLIGRNLKESYGCIQYKMPSIEPTTFDDIGDMNQYDQKYFGMGQGSLRVTVLQVANSMATIARGGIFMTPLLYKNLADPGLIDIHDLNLSPETIKTVHAGLHAVVNKPHGTAYDVFKTSDFTKKGITVYGKTGSTQGPENAWFCGFAKDQADRCIAVALVVEGGQSGSHDGAPIGKAVLEICADQGYIGKPEETLNK